MKIVSFILMVLLAPMMGQAATHDYVDLGLPSMTLWATCNVGATTPEGYGSYFAWGETATKKTYSWSNYKYCSSASSATMEMVGEEWNCWGHAGYDAALASWGGDWYMPRVSQMLELVECCRFEATTSNGVKGMKVTGPNGNSIFLPCAGYKYDSKTASKGTECYYWTGSRQYDYVYKDSKDPSKAFALYAKDKSVSGEKSCQLRTGMPIRPVRMPEPEIVDLGLRVDWASHNVGAASPEERGRFYAWGETFTKSSYTWSNYKYADGTASSVKDIEDDISCSLYDVASRSWEEALRNYYGNADGLVVPPTVGGGGWELPQEDDWNELIQKCTFKTATVNGVKGYRVTGPNGNSIFLPFAGCSYDGKIMGENSYAYYWSGNIDTDNHQKARAMYVKAGEKKVTSAQRRTGIMVRPVYKNHSIPPSPNPPVPPVWEDIHLVDLGLSVRWADRNTLGMAPGSDEGNGFFAWGETEEKGTYTWANYEYANGTSNTCQAIGDDISNTEYDAASFWNMSYDEEEDDWLNICLPTEAQWQELIQNCTFKVELDEEERRGYRVTGPSGRSIFLPFTGCSYDGKEYGANDYAYYWTANADKKYSNKAKAAYLKSGDRKTTSIQRRTGVAVRAVEYVLPPDPNPGTGTLKFEPVDLGLSVDWCSQNIVDALSDYSNPDLYRYAWGETETKESYTWENYNPKESVNNYEGGLADNAVFDAAVAYSSWMLGKDDVYYRWRMPSVDEVNELLEKCTFEDVQGGVLVKGPSGNTIFLPYTGCSYDGKDFDNVDYGYMWTSSPDPSNSKKAKALYIKKGARPVLLSAQRRTGCAIRPVVAKVKYVDLGLPSGNLWAKWNLSARSPEEAGWHFAWGEFFMKPDYTWANYTLSKGTAKTAFDLGCITDSVHVTIISQTESSATYGYYYYDVVRYYSPSVIISYVGPGVDDHRYHGHLPTRDEFQELIDHTTKKEGLYNGVEGVWLTGHNGNRLFFPYAGSYYDGKTPKDGTLSYYWTGNQSSNIQKAYALSVNNGNLSITECQRRTGLPIRAVFVPENDEYSNNSIFETDAIRNVNGRQIDHDDDIYTLQGVKVGGTLKPGIYIRNGRKFVVK